MAWQLLKAFQRENWVVHEVFSRTLANAQTLIGKHHTIIPTDQLDFSNSQAQLFILCVADQAMETVVKKLVLPPNAILVHTSGSQPMQLLADYHPQVGVFYPFQTMSKGKMVDFKQLPICLEAVNEQVMQLIQSLASALTDRVYHLSSESRKRLHLAAVFACNFVNHLFSLSQEVLQEADMDLGILEHLIRETVEKAFSMPPKEAQTGPAVRGDQSTIATHLQLLESNDQLKNSVGVYQLLSDSIDRFHQVKK